jgi:hypothetical protein
MLATISESGATSDIALSIALFILDYHTSAQIHVYSVRATMVYPLAHYDYCWMVLEWKEETDTDILAIFLIDDETEPGDCNWLIHRGCGGSDGGWNRISTSWRVTDLGRLKALFGGARHTLGMSELSAADSIILHGNFSEITYTFKEQHLLIDPGYQATPSFSAVTS